MRPRPSRSHDHFGFLVDTPEIRALIDETHAPDGGDSPTSPRASTRCGRRSRRCSPPTAGCPTAARKPDETSRMGGGIGQYALYRAEDKSLCLFSLVVPAGAATPVHDHLAWGLVGIYRGRQDETVYRRLDDGRDPARARSRGRQAPAARPRRVLHAAAADRRHPLRQHDLRHAVDLDSSARQRHRLRLAPQVRAGHRRRDAVPLRLRERAVSAGDVS